MRLMIRKARKSDLEIIDELYVTNSVEETLRQFPKRSQKDVLKEFRLKENSRKRFFLSELKKRSNVFIIAECGGEVVGFGQGLIEKSYGGKMGLLDKIYLNRDSRGKGFGTKIARYLMKEMKKQKIDFFEWRCYASNVCSIKLAEKLGLKPFSARFRKSV